MVALVLEKAVDEVGRIGDESLGVLVDGRDGKDCVLANISMSMLEAGSRRGEKRFDELGFAEFAQKSKGVASDILVCMLEIVSDAVAVAKDVSTPLDLGARKRSNLPDQDHLLLELP